MATENPELEEINRLLEVEKAATALITDAMTEADKRMSEARSKYNEQVKSQLDKITEELTSDYNSKLETIKTNHSKFIENFKSDLMQKELNQSGLNALLDKLLISAQ